MARAANAALQNAAQKLVLGTKGDAMVQYPIHLGTEALQQLSAQGTVPSNVILRWGR